MALTFPDGFLWGTATSSHQVEGDNVGNDWWDWEQQPGHIRGGDRSGSACGWWAGRAEADLALARELGQNAHRLSLEWSRLEPEPGRFDAAAFERYHALLEHMRRVGLSAFVTLNHFTLPRWAARRGAWQDRGLVERFAAFAGECARRLGDGVATWATFNEPSVLMLSAYLGPRWPPGANSVGAARLAMVHMLEAHAAGARAVREARPGARVGIVHNAPFIEPHRPGHPLDALVARAQDHSITGVLLHALETGRLVFPLSLLPHEVPGLKGSVDFLGLNYYGRYEVKFDPRARELMGRHVQTPSVRLEPTDWGQVSPRGLEEQLVRLSRLGVPVYVTENGIYDVDDSQRPGFLVEHVRAVHRAIARGADVRGYFHWSLLDNFEWAEGWHAPFGLVAVDRATGTRTPKPSAHVYAAICRANGLSEAGPAAAAAG